MSKLRQQWLHASNWILFGILFLLGFSGCGLTSQEELMYGTPTAKYNIKGKVIDADTKAAIPGILVTSGIALGSYDRVEYRGTKIFTDAKGEFQLSRKEGAGEQYRFIWEDTAQNIYKKDSIDIPVAGKYVNGDGWYWGETELNVTLEVKKQTPQ